MFSLTKARILLCNIFAVFTYTIWFTDTVFAFEDKDCSRIEKVEKKYSIVFKQNDNIEEIRAKATREIIKQGLAEVIGYEVHSNRERNTQIHNDDIEEKFQDAEKAYLDGLAKVSIISENQLQASDERIFTLDAEVKVCVPKSASVRKAEKEQEERLQHPPKAVDPSSNVSWFNPASGQPQIWYSRQEDGSFSFYDNQGYDPNTGAVLRPISAKTLKEWRVFQERRKQEEIARVNEVKRAAVQKALDDEKERIAAQKHADLIEHARENCDKYAANPNDPDKPRNLPGISYDNLKASVSDAIESCEAAIAIEPSDRRLRYQLARAYSVTDPKRSLAFFKVLCDQHYRAAFDNYGWGLLDRRLGLNNLQGAANSFRRGAELGDTDAMVSLATFMQQGRIQENYPNEALSLFQKAAALGNEDAKRAIESVLAAQRQLEQQQQQDLRNAQAVMGIIGGVLGGVRR
ncbi:tetratricopeptide repeat protein [Beijerinckia indica]|uniref:Sel1 domain protein repeat-containing protein n=1 Tax=Beijerinckia indica subsp. indica (strain ATCC 9039 / DSM 1715 / NCIMB 8712) TaxID=395963 RepID=B2ID48_BEII9|nr:sel1 repeat family protein [Beijerinckia indica]ACB96813.1 Sel1 domain protein repeat-containing protein [Beijerinckia indica subsp. indica ATCC 9039]